MSDELPPPQPTEPPPPVERVGPAYNPPNFWGMFFLGILLVPLSILLCFGMQSPAPIGLVAVGVFISVFFKGYRGLFAGFVGVIGLLFLAFIVICGSSPHF